MKTYNAIYDKVLSTDSKRFETHNKALLFFTKKLCKHQVFTLIEHSFLNGERVYISNTYKIYDGVAELVF